MPIMNYTTTVSPTKSLQEITSALVSAGATAIAQRYDQHGNVTALEFAIAYEGQLLRYSLPLRPDEVARVLATQRVAGQYLRPEHVRRVAWRILRDWVKAQIAVIQSGMLTMPEVMFPYMHTGDGSTVWQAYREAGLPQLTVGRRP
jgi:hypothetical protein